MLFGEFSGVIQRIPMSELSGRYRNDKRNRALPAGGPKTIDVSFSKIFRTEDILYTGIDFFLRTRVRAIIELQENYIFGTPFEKFVNFKYTEKVLHQNSKVLNMY